MKLYNSLTRKIETFEPISPPTVTIYTCGPTVYDHVHIGNLRTYIFEDTLRRVLKSSDYKIKHVMNITDIDDKTIARSKKQYPGDHPSDALKKLTGHYESIFLDDAKKVGIDFSGSTLARATQHIKAMQELIRKIPNKYMADDGIYFDIENYPQYGKLVNLDRSHAHHRIQNDEYDKDHVADFALWKAKKEGEPSWDFEIDGKNMPGHPGWHIECSTMSTKYLGQPFDIHTGGIDLMFPHHENEIAQSTAASHKDLAKVFVHGEHLLVNGKKMSKSLNNFYTLEDIIKHNFDPLAFRLLVLQAHYRSQLNFTWDSLAACAYSIKNIQDNFSWIYQSGIIVDSPYPSLSSSFQKLKERIVQALENDLNTPEAIAALNEFADGFATIPASQLDIPLVEDIAEFIDKTLGIPILDKPRYDLPAHQRKLITERDNERNDKHWEKADNIKSQLTEQGLSLLKDTPHGSIWYKS